MKSPKQGDLLCLIIHLVDSLLAFGELKKDHRTSQTVIKTQSPQEGPPLTMLHKSMFIAIIKKLQTREPPKPDSSIKSALYTLHSTSNRFNLKPVQSHPDAAVRS